MKDVHVSSMIEIAKPVMKWPYLESNGVRCPKCQHCIEKSSGGNHMTCRKNVGSCGPEFCCLCGADYNGDEGIRAVEKQVIGIYSGPVGVRFGFKKIVEIIGFGLW